MIRRSKEIGPGVSPVTKNGGDGEGLRIEDRKGGWGFASTRTVHGRSDRSRPQSVRDELGLRFLLSSVTLSATSCPSSF